jgi:hypothetical protein
MKTSKKKDLYNRYGRINRFRLWLLCEKNADSYFNNKELECYTEENLEKELKRHTVSELERMCNYYLRIFFEPWYVERMPKGFAALKTKLNAIISRKGDTENKLKDRRNSSLDKIIKSAIGNRFEFGRMKSDCEFEVALHGSWMSPFSVYVCDVCSHLTLNYNTALLNADWDKNREDDRVLGWEAAAKFYRNKKAWDDVSNTLKQYQFDIEANEEKANTEINEVLDETLKIIDRELEKLPIKN